MRLQSCIILYWPPKWDAIHIQWANGYTRTPSTQWRLHYDTMSIRIHYYDCGWWWCIFANWVDGWQMAATTGMICPRAVHRTRGILQEDTHALGSTNIPRDFLHIKVIESQKTQPHKNAITHKYGFSKCYVTTTLSPSHQLLLPRLLSPNSVSLTPFIASCTSSRILGMLSNLPSTSMPMLPPSPPLIVKPWYIKVYPVLCDFNYVTTSTLGIKVGSRLLGRHIHQSS